MTIRIGQGVLRGVPLFFDIGNDRFAPLSVVEDDGSGDAGLLLTQLKQPTSNGNSSQLIPSANALDTANYTQATQRNALMVMNTPYTHDPVQGTVSLRRNTGGLAGSVAITHTNIQAQDVRSFLYGVDTDTNTQSVPLLATAAGLLRIESTPNIADTVTTAANQATATGSNTSIATANTDRRFVIVQNVDATDSVTVGDTNITATRGIVLAPGESVTFETTAEIFARALANTPNVAVLEIESS